MSDRVRPRSEPDPSGGESPRLTIFMRGVTIGALVGAAIAGSAIWERVRRDRNAQEIADAEESTRTIEGPEER